MPPVLSFGASSGRDNPNMPFFQTPELKLYYQTAGDGPPLLLLHGLGSSSQDWPLQIPDLAPTYSLLMPDIRGHGRSDKPAGPYQIKQFATDISQWLTHLNLGPAHLLGISMGGMIALQLALDAPHQVRSLILANTAAELRPHNLQQRLQIWQRLLLSHLFSMRRIGTILAGRFFPRPEQAPLRAEFIEHWAKNDKRAYLAAMHALLGWSVTQRLSEIQCPTLILTADQDYIPPIYRQQLAAGLPHAQWLTIHNSRHASPADQPAQFNAAVLGFLAKMDIIANNANSARPS